jgi:hypothetical protein
LLFVLVLTMISGARELMTPGAWESSGVTYRLKQKSGSDESQEDARKQQMTRLKEALWRYARANGGRFPSSQSDPAVAAKLWELPDAGGLQYVYLGGIANALDPIPLVIEPEVYGSDRWVLFTDGTLRQCTRHEIDRALAESK